MLIALLPIKAHSQRVPGKNFRDFCDKPLYTWILETLLDCPLIDRVVVDTDHEPLIDQLHARYPAVQTLLRPESLRGDMTSMNDIIAYDITQAPADAYLQTHATNPLLTVQTICAAITAYQTLQSPYDSLFSVNRIQARTYWRDGTPINPTLGELKRTQDLEPVFEENSNLFLFSPASFAASGSRLGLHPALFETPKMESLDIDEEEDFRFAQLVMGARLKEAQP